ncbi:MAG: hypothetical protein AB7F99_09360 [Vicinamibacterales bacterium]
MSSTWVRHITAVAVFAALACTVSWPLPLHLSTHLPGPGIGDNVQFLWNFWWMRTALAQGVDFFYTPSLFAPFGADITLHSHTALPAFLGATIFGWLPLVTAHNVLLLGSLFLNGLCAYLLALRTTRDFGAALLAGLLFGSSPYLAAHLNGHFNLTAAWTIPLFALALQAAGLGVIEGPASAPRPPRAPIAGVLFAGMVLGLTAYVDYYYVVYQVAFACVAWAWTTHSWGFAWRGPGGSSRRVALGLAALAAIDAALLVAIGLTGGFRLDLGPLTISARSAFNPLQALWILIALAAVCYWRPSLTARAILPRRRTGITVALIFAVAGVLAAPILWHGAAIWMRGEYVTQEYFWRSAPRGVDLGTLVLGHPFHGLWGTRVRGLYEALGIDPIESGAWFGLVPFLTTVLAVRFTWRETTSRYWLAIGGFFFVWSLGPHLTMFGLNTGLILPQTFLRYLPIAGNARVPGRAIVVVYLAAATIVALAVARRRESGFRPGLLGLSAVVVLELIPAPFPLSALETPGIYAVLDEQIESGTLLELPVGTRDSFQTQGELDHHVLAYQTVHGRPIVGGVVSRLSPAIVAGYEADALIGPLLRTSAPGAAEVPDLPDRATAARLLEAHGIGFVMLNRERASVELVRYVDDVLPLTLLANDGTRSLFAVTGLAP